MSKYVDDYTIRDQAEEMVTILEEAEQALTNFQIDLDTNKLMREELKWDYDDLAKSLSDALFNARALAEDANEVIDGEDDEDEDEDEKDEGV